MAVEACLLLPQNGSACMSHIQDAGLALYDMTRRDEFFTRNDAMQLCVAATLSTETDGVLDEFPEWCRRLSTLPVPAIVKAPGCNKGPMWTGKQIFSRALPPCADFQLNAVRNMNTLLDIDSSLDVEERYDEGADVALLLVRNELLCGRAGKYIIGKGQGTLAQQVYTSPSTRYNNCGVEYERMRRIGVIGIFATLNAIAMSMHLLRGFSIGLGDMCIDVHSEAARKIRTLTDGVESQVKKLVDERFLVAAQADRESREQRRSVSTPSVAADELVYLFFSFFFLL